MQTLLAQLTLSLSSTDEASFENFYSSANAGVVDQLQKAVRGQGEKVVYIYGQHGQGCSHLLQASCHFAHQHKTSSVYLPLSYLVTLSPEVLNGLETLSVICIDDIETIAGVPAWEEAIFHLYNRVYDAGGHIIIGAHASPKTLGIQLPDLVSRLAWGVVLSLHTVSDEEKLYILTMRAQERGIHLSDEVGRYIMTHCPRQMKTLFAALDMLDKASLAAQRKLTIPFVKEVLQI